MKVTLGGVELNDSMIPSLGWSADEDGKFRMIPKVGLPFVSLDTANVSLDF